MPGPFKVISSRDVQAQFRAVARAAIHAGRGNEVLRAMRQINQLLERAPRGVGDPMYRVRSMQLRVRNVVVSPLYDEYGIHDTEAVVFIRYVASIRGPLGPV